MKEGRKTSGARYKRPKKKKLTGRQGQARVVKIGERKTKLIRNRNSMLTWLLLSFNIFSYVNIVLHSGYFDVL